MPQSVRLTYYNGIAQGVTPQQIDDAVKQFAQLVTQAGGPVIDLLPVVEIPEQIAMIVDGRCDIALMNPLGYVFAQRQNANVVPIAIALRTTALGTEPTYLSQVYVNVATGITDVPGLLGRSFGFGSSMSTSNFLVPAAELRNRGVHPLTGPHTVRYLGHHDQVAQAVYDGVVDAGAGHDGVIDDLSKIHPDAPQKLKRLFWSTPIPSDPIASNLTGAELQQLTTAVVSVGTSLAGKAAIATFWGTPNGLAAVQPTAGIKDSTVT
ncbi:MAG: PhnD/SsuA/transferrin family substrate-binding protein [Candidatus Cybelea sp.]